MTQLIVYLSWPASEISGGITTVFRHVEALREAGHNAVVATPDAKPPGWFKSSVPVIDAGSVVRGEDTLVFPENHPGFLKALANWPNRKVVFCQNWCMVVRGLGERREYADFGISQIVCVDPFTASYCRLRFPTLPVSILPVSIDRGLFHFQSPEENADRLHAAQASGGDGLYSRSVLDSQSGLPPLSLVGNPRRR